MTTRVVTGRLHRRVSLVGWAGDIQVRLDIGGTGVDPDFSVFVSGNDPLASLPVGQCLPKSRALPVVRRVTSIRRDGKHEIRFDLGGVEAKAIAHLYCRRASIFQHVQEGDVVVL